MVRAIDAANFFIVLFENYKEDNDLTNMKINKLLYYAQGHSYARHDRPLFNDTIEAWDNGPVVYGVYSNLKQYDRGAVSQPIGKYDPAVFSDEEVDLLLDVAREYGKYSAAALRNMTHREGTPWRKHYDGGYHTQIPQADIAEFFMKCDALPSFEFDPDTETIGYVEDGCLVLPREEFDEWDY